MKTFEHDLRVWKYLTYRQIYIENTFVWFQAEFGGISIPKMVDSTQFLMANYVIRRSIET